MTVTEELRRVEQHNPGWHTWRTPCACWATTCHCHDPNGSGCTLDAPDPGALDEEIAKYERDHEGAAA